MFDMFDISVSDVAKYLMLKVGILALGVLVLWAIATFSVI